jgi:subtilisin family serine protease
MIAIYQQDKQPMDFYTLGVPKFICRSIDTGVSVKHPDVNVIESLSFMENEIGLTDLNGHGTAVATTIAAKNNSVYTLGICPGAQVHSYKVLGEDGSGYFSYSLAAIEKAIEFREQYSNVPMIVNMSLGGYVGNSDYTALDYAISNLVCTYHVPVVVAAGNETDDASTYSPAHCKEAITVGSYSQSNELSWFSNYGSDLDILAPGESLAVAYKKFSQDYMSGTSFAAPIVSGCIGTYLMENPSASPSQIKTALQEMPILAAQCNVSASITHGYANTTHDSVYIGDIV